MPKKSPYRSLYKELLAELESMLAHYQMEKVGIPPRIQEKAKSILNSENLEAARDVYRRTIDSMELEALVLWGKGKIQGPLTPENLESQARKAENFHKLHKRKGNDKVAKQQLEKAESLRKKAQELRRQKGD